MKKPAMTLLLLLFVTLCLAQQNRKASIYISAQYSETLYDRVKPNNPNLFGLGVQVYLRNASPLKPTAEVTAELVGP
ncbi:MAG TPA: hypothetical protein VD996_14335, partial [Chitinophagaceae bacterium]|nr:hypothetical protein [Chitinophagaceae bacterium]